MKRTVPSSGPRRYTVVYDGTCTVCTRLSRALGKWDRDGDLEMVPSQDPGLIERFPSIPSAAYADALQLIGPNGQRWQGSAAIEELLNVLPRGRLIGWVFSIPLARGLADRFYRWFARNRYHMGCGAHCRASGGWMP